MNVNAEWIRFSIFDYLDVDGLGVHPFSKFVTEYLREANKRKLANHDG